MKICLLLSTFTYDGIKRSVVHYANEMDRLGHEVWVGVLHEWPGKVSLRSELRIPAERVVSWEGLGQGRREWAILQFFRKQRFDVVHCSTVKMNHIGRWTGLLAHVPCLVASEDNLCLKRSLKTRLEDRLLAHLTDGVVMISRAVADSFMEVEKLAPEKVHVIYYGLPLQGFEAVKKSSAELAHKRAELGIPVGPTLACAARLHFSKALDVTLHAFHQLVKKIPSAQFILAGDGDERPALEKLRTELGLEKNFHLIGARGDIYDILQLADAVTLNSDWEGLGFSLMEGMAFGKPLVGTDVTGINEIIIEGKNGLLVPPRNPEKLAEAWHQALTDPALREKLQKGCREVLQDRFDIQKNTGQLIELYQKILHSRGQK